MLESFLSLTPPAQLTPAEMVAWALVVIFLIVVLARVLGNLFVKIGQPRVIGEILAGVLLGPTLLGANASHVLAPTQVRPIIFAFATMGLILFMFLAGIEYDASKLKGRGRQASVLAVLAVLLPALLGFPVAALMHDDLYAGPNGTSFVPFALFIGAALSVTAFPVMAHILIERGELNSRMGSLAVATAAVMSVLMFLYIAFASSVATGDFATLASQIGGVLVLGLVSLLLVRPLLRKTLPRQVEGERVEGSAMAIIFAGAVIYGFMGDRLGIHAMVGGFLWGLLIPGDRLRRLIAEKIKDVAMVFLLPVFFAQAGLATDLKLLTLGTLPVVAVVLLAAVGSKFLAAVPARAFGLSWRDVGTLGALLNTRGLLVLVAGLMGLQLEIISTTTFTIIVIVALVTNLMTLPLLVLFARHEPLGQAVAFEQPE